VGPERRAGADGDRLHADVRVHGAADQLLLEQLHGADLEGPDLPHAQEEVLEHAHVVLDGSSRHQPPWSMIAIVVPTLISSPSSTRMDSMRPETAASISWFAFSASTSTSGSPSATFSPSRFSQPSTVPYSISA